MKDKDLDKLLKRIYRLVDLIEEDYEECIEFYPKMETLQTFRITEKVATQMEEELGKNWLSTIGIS